MLNAEQQKAVNQRDCNLLVSASAGSGKTKVLITRIANMILNNETDISKILVVTFTKASATEMKERLISELSQLRQQATDSQIKERLLNQIEEIPLSDISTIHSFCSKIVRKYFYQLNLDPAFKLVEENLTQLKLDAINNVINNYINENDKEFEALFYVFNQKRNTTKLIETVFNVSEIMHKTNNIVKNQLAGCFNSALENNSALNYMKNFIDKTATLLLEKIKEYVSNCVIVEDKFTMHLSTCISFLNSVISAKTFIEKYNIILQTKFPINKLKENKVEYDYVKKLIASQLIEPIGKMFNKLTTEVEISQNIFASNWLTKKLIEVTEKYNNQFFELKQKNAILDLTDIETLMLKLLENESVCAELKDSYNYIFVDEYQDTNEIQEKILTSIAKPNNMFMVGDAKQSIYGFRLCDPSIFTNKYDAFKNNGINQKIDLNKNYRSNRNILEFTNAVCSKCITKEFGNINYLKDSMLETEIQIPSVKNVPSVQVFVIPKQKTEKKEVLLLNGEIYSVMQDNLQLDNDNEIVEQEAKLIATQIASIVGNPLVVTENNVEKIKTIKYSDICVLSRTKKGYLQKLATILNSYEIPVKVSFRDNIYENFEVKILIDALETINNFYNDVSLCSTLNNLFAFDLSELAEIRKQTNKKYFYEALIEYKEIKNALAKKIINFFEILEELKIKSEYFSLFEIINEIINKCNYLTYLSCFNNNKEKVENVKIFLNSIKGMNKTLNEFLQDVKLKLNNNEKELNLDNGENSVKLDSIHSSKGLEYPVVILTNFGKDLTRKINTDFVKFNKDIGISCSIYNIDEREKSSNIIEEIIKFANKQQEFEEDIRLLYVALTRAKNNLIIIGEADLEKIEPIKSSLDLVKCKSYMQLILGSLNLNEQKLINNNFINLPTAQINIVKPEVLNQNNNIKRNDILFQKIELNNSDKAVIDEILNFNYKYKNSTVLPVKNSVTQLNEMSEHEVCYNFAPKKLTANEAVVNLQANEIGNAYHLVMQYADFSCSEQDIVKLLDSLVALNILSCEQKNSIEINKVINCLECVKPLVNSNSEILKEQPFIMKDSHCNLVEGSEIQDEVLVQGIIDLLIINNNSAIVVDYKTTRASEEKLKEIYKKQLDLYKKSVQNSTKIQNVECYIYSFFLGKMVKI